MARVAGWFALAALLPCAASAPPEVAILALFEHEYVDPATSYEARGDLRIRFPPDAQCADGARFRIVLEEVPGFVNASLAPAEGLVSASEIRPGENATLPFLLNLRIAELAPAYERVDLRLRATTEPCGNLNASTGRLQIGAEVAFRPRAALRLDDQDRESWTVHAASGSNAPVVLRWQLLQPSLGRVTESGEVRVDGAGGEAAFRVPKAAVDKSAEARVEVRIEYVGTTPPTGEPAWGSASLVVHRPSSAGSGALLLIGGGAGMLGVLLLILWGRRRVR